MPHVVAIVGRPNVGKSTLFNRLLGERRAIVHDRPGVTRDRNYGTLTWGNREVVLVDTGGYEPEPGTDLLATMREQVEEAIEEADALVFVLDRKAGLTPPDRETARLLRASRRPTVVAVNKVDEHRHEMEMADFWSLGFDRLYPVSAEHDRGTSHLLEALDALLPPPTPEAPPFDSEPELEPEGESPEGDPREIRIAILGRPNVGKSTLANRLTGSNRHLVHDAPGTTMDAVDSPFQVNGRPYRLVDTAGIRRKARIHDRLEAFAVSRAIRTIERCHVTLHLLDGRAPPTAQDARLLQLVVERGRALLVLVNRWDQVRDLPDRTSYHVEDELEQHLPHVSWAPHLFVSALTGKGCGRIIPLVDEVFSAFDTRISTPRLNRFLREIEATHPPPQRYHRPVRLHYVSQPRVRPPTFAFHCNTPDGIKAPYRRFLVNRLRSAFDLYGTPIRVHIRRKRRPGEKPA